MVRRYPVQEGVIISFLSQHHKLCSEDEPFVEIHDFEILTRVDIGDIDHRLASLDGCGGQYKNFKNFFNLFSHKVDFSIKAEWIFFATSHGKSPCDGIGAVVKLHTAKRSSQRPLNNQILNYRSVL